METLEKKVRQVLEEAGWEKPSIRILPEGSHLVATVTSSSFDGMDGAERQALVWDVLDSALSSNEHARVDLVVVTTPSEQAA